MRVFILNNVPMTLGDLALSIQILPFGHTSSYVELADGRIFHSSYRVYTISEDGGMSWSGVTELRDVKGKQLLTTSAVKLSERDGIGCLGTTRSENPSLKGPSGNSPRYVQFWWSDDNGQTWSEPEAVSPPDSAIDTNVLHDAAKP